MPFLRAGFNAKHRRTGLMAWTRALRGSRFEPAHCVIETREEVPAWEWVEKRRREMSDERT